MCVLCVSVCLRVVCLKMESPTLYRQRKLVGSVRNMHVGAITSLHFLAGQPVLLSAAEDNSLKVSFKEQLCLFMPLFLCSSVLSTLPACRAHSCGYSTKMMAYHASGSSGAATPRHPPWRASTARVIVAM